MTSLPLKQLGKDGPQVPCIGFGLMGLSAAYGAVGSTEERLKVLDRAYELGERFWDSADLMRSKAYADSEDLVGEWFRRHGKREDVSMLRKSKSLQSPPVAKESPRMPRVTPSMVAATPI
ncbi:MAG: hypothetical protein Q9186_006351 [Xanthomendoza sp. 1 TL-2023]